jgi:hypothetical protein
MSRRGWLGIIAAAVGVVLIGGAIVFQLVNSTALNRSVNPLDTIVWATAWFGFGIVGAVILARRDDQPIGWVLVGITFSMGITLAAGGYGEYAQLVSDDSLAFGDLSVWVGLVVAPVPFVLVPVLLLAFPDGAAPRGRMRWALRALVTLGLMMMALFAVKPVETAEEQLVVENPIAWEAAGPILEFLTGLLGTSLALLFVVTVVDMVRRYRRSTGMRRQQFRWLARASLVAPTLFALGLVSSMITGDVRGVYQVGDVLIVAAFTLGLTAMAAGIGVAVLRYRLYDIDRVVSRTVTYGALTLVLAAVYAGLVLGAQWLLGPEDASDLVVAGATLVVAALFRPLRNRLRRMIDRRFNRARYDADGVVAAFGARLRDEVDLGALTGELRAVVTTTMMPAQAGIWVRESGP